MSLHAATLPELVSFWANPEALESLFGSGWDHRTTSHWSGTALSLAAHHGRPLIAEAILKRDPKAEDAIGTDLLRPVQLAAVQTVVNYKTVEALLRNGADVNAAGEYPNALLMAVERDRLDLCLLLTDYGIDVNHIARNSKAPLVRAALSAKDQAVDIVRLLIEKGADLNAAYKHPTPRFFGFCLTTARTRREGILLKGVRSWCQLEKTKRKL